MIFEGTFEQFKQWAPTKVVDQELIRELAKKYFSDEIAEERAQRQLKLTQDRWRELTDLQGDGTSTPAKQTTSRQKPVVLRIPVNNVQYPNQKERFNRVTDFSSWVFSLYHRRGNTQAMAKGKIGERRVKIKKRIPRVTPDSNWEL